jgi:hypothetical protein
MNLRLPCALTSVALLLFANACATGARGNGFEEAAEARKRIVVVEDAAPPFAFASEAGNAAADAGIPSDTAKLADAGPSTAQCAREIEFGSIRASNVACYTNESIAHAKGTLRYSCATGGDVTVTFGKQTFRGTITGTYLSIANVETFVFPSESDPACRWRSTQVIEGNLGEGTLAYQYTEAVATPGLCTATPCFTSGTLSVVNVSKEAPAPR